MAAASESRFLAQDDLERMAGGRRRPGGPDPDRADEERPVQAPPPLGGAGGNLLDRDRVGAIGGEPPQLVRSGGRPPCRR